MRTFSSNSGPASFCERTRSAWYLEQYCTVVVCYSFLYRTVNETEEEQNKSAFFLPEDERFILRWLLFRRLFFGLLLSFVFDIITYAT